MDKEKEEATINLGSFLDIVQEREQFSKERIQKLRLALEKIVRATNWDDHGVSLIAREALSDDLKQVQKSND